MFKQWRACKLTLNVTGHVREQLLLNSKPSVQQVKPDRKYRLIRFASSVKPNLYLLFLFQC